MICHVTSYATWSAILQILRKAKPRKKRTTMYPIVASTLKFHKDDDVDPEDAGSACWGWTTKRRRELSWMHLIARATLVIYNLLVPIVISAYLSFHYFVSSCQSAIMLHSLVQSELSYNLLLKDWLSMVTLQMMVFSLFEEKKVYCKQWNIEKIWCLKEYDAWILRSNMES